MKSLMLIGLLTTSCFVSTFAQCSFSIPPVDYKSKSSSGTWGLASGWVAASGNNPVNSASTLSNPVKFWTSFNAATNGVWSCTTYCSCINCYVVPPNTIVDIESSQFQVNGNLLVYGTLIVNGNMQIGNNGTTYSIYFDDGASVCCTSNCSPASSDKLTVNSNGSTNLVWGGSGGTTTVSGPVSSNGSGPLPVTLVAFYAQVNDKNAILNWATASEVNFDFFSLQRSSNGKDFYEIAQVKGQGTSSGAHSYSYEDTNPIIGRSYYRLITNDFDGYQEIFKVISVDYQGEKKFSVSPNPSDGSSVKLNFNFENDSDAQLVIYDNLGSALGTYHILGASAINFDSQLKSGVYLAKYTSASFTKTERFIVK